MFDTSSVSVVAVIVAAIANVVIGTVWYMPAVFGRRWAELAGRPIDTSPNPMLYAIAVIGSLVTAYVLALVVSAVGAATITDGIVTGLVVWVGFQATNQAVGGAFEGRPWMLWGINTANGAVSMAVMGAILAAMG